MMARVRWVILSSMETGSRHKYSFSISANTGMALYINGAVAEADQAPQEEEGQAALGRVDGREAEGRRRRQEVEEEELNGAHGRPPIRAR